MASKTKLANGKLYGSSSSALQVLLVGRNPIRWNAVGNAIEWQKEIMAEFAFHGQEYKFQNHLTGAQDTAADIRGHFFDSVAQGEQKGWTQEEHDMMVDRLDTLCEEQPGLVWVITAAKAEKPWPKYDDAHHNQIPVLAEQLGLVVEALVYEEQNQNRPSVVAKLSELVNAAETEEELTAA